jgi:hypothetical protein
MNDDLKIEWLEEFAARLKNIKIFTKRIPLVMLRTIFAEVFAHRPGIPQRRDWLLKALRFAEQKEIIALPKKSWEQTGKPPLPKYVNRVLETPTRNTWWKDFYWHSQLEWVLDLPYLSEKDGEFLRKVQQGLREGWFDQSAPLNRRSVELTGKEKRLKDLLKSSLFTEDRLSPQILNITSDVMPLAHEFIGRKPIALVFENKEPYNVARSVLESLSDAPYGILAYGNGGSFVDSVRDFLRIQNSKRYQEFFDKSLEQIHYVGDIDWAGLRIARGASLKTEKYGLPPLVPAVGIHRLMLDSLQHSRILHPEGFPDDKIKKARIADSSLVEWLPAEVQEEILRILNLNNRIPEEMLTEESLLNLWNAQKKYIP